MTAFVGRKAILSVGTPLVAVAALQTKTLTLANEPIDITTDDDNSFRTMLIEPGTKTLDISFEGVAKDVASLNTLIALANSTANVSENFSILFPAIGTYAGNFVLTSFEVGATFNEAATFSCSIQSSGAYTFVAIA